MGAKSKLTTEQWSELWIDCEVKGLTWADLSRKYGISTVYLRKRARETGRGPSDEVKESVKKATRRRLDEKVSGIITHEEHKKIQQQVDVLADKASDVILRHRDELQRAREISHAARDAHIKAGRDDLTGLETPEEKATIVKRAKVVAFEDLKACKIHVETLLLIQSGERKSWNLDEIEVEDMSSKTDEELAAIVKGG